MSKKIKKRLGQEVSHEEIHKAMKKFLGKGGKVSHLPEQTLENRHSVDWEKYQDYEQLSSILPI